VSGGGKSYFVEERKESERSTSASPKREPVHGGRPSGGYVLTHDWRKKGLMRHTKKGKERGCLPEPSVKKGEKRIQKGEGGENRMNHTHLSQ